MLGSRLRQRLQYAAAGTAKTGDGRGHGAVCALLPGTAAPAGRGVGVSAYDADARKFRDGQLQRFIDKAEVWLCGEQEAGRTPLDLDATTAARVFVWGGYQAVAG